MSLNVLSLFAGIGGLDLGLERAGMTVVGQVEIDPYCRRVLAKHWPDVPQHDDVRTAAEWWLSEERPVVDVICGGFPCQDISSANTRGRHGLAGAKSSLWRDMCVIVRDVRPRWVIVENSSEWRRWAPNVRADLLGLGYGTAALRLSAGSFGAPHKRPRVLVVADAHSQGEPLRTFYEKVAGLSPLPRRSEQQARAATVGMGYGLPTRMDQLRALGNAVYPAVAQYVGELILSESAA